MGRWLQLESYHWAALLAGLGLCATIVAWVSVDLVRLTMANVQFLGRFGTEALREGGLVQLLGIGVRAVVVLLVYLGFKGIEAELIHRWRNSGR